MATILLKSNWYFFGVRLHKMANIDLIQTSDKTIASDLESAA